MSASTASCRRIAATSASSAPRACGSSSASPASGGSSVVPSAFEMAPEQLPLDLSPCGRRDPGAIRRPRHASDADSRRRGDSGTRHGFSHLPARRSQRRRWQRRGAARLAPRRRRARRAPGAGLGCRAPLSARGVPRSRSLREAAVERAGTDELLFADGRSRQEPYLCIETSPQRRVSLTLARASRRRGECSSPGAYPPGQALMPSLALESAAPRGSAGERAAQPRGDGALVRAERARPLPLAARSRAVLGRRLGDPRRLPGAGRDAARAGTTGAAARPRAARHGQPESGRRLAAVVHVLRARARHPRRRLARRHRLLAAGGARAISHRLGRCRCSRARVSVLRFARPGRRRARDGLGARRARPRAHRQAAHSRHRARRLRPRRLERFPAACRSGDARAHVQRLDGHAAFPGADDAGAGVAVRRARGRAQPLEQQAEAVRADFQRLLLPDGVLTGYAVFDSAGRRALPAASAGRHDRRPLQLSRHDPRASSRTCSRRIRRARIWSSSDGSSPDRTAYACSTGRCRITAARSGSSSAPRARPSSAARSA